MKYNCYRKMLIFLHVIQTVCEQIFFSKWSLINKEMYIIYIYFLCKCTLYICISYKDTPLGPLYTSYEQTVIKLQ